MDSNSSKNSSKIVIIGFGWVGQANAIALAIEGLDVYFFDVAPPKFHYKDKYEDIYKKIKPLSSPLEVDGENVSYVICVGDRVAPDGLQDISLIEKAINTIKATKGKIILRSTVLPENLIKLHFDYYIPEFLHEKYAIEESIKPHLFVLGLKDIDEDFVPDFVNLWKSKAERVFIGSFIEASFIKYLSNIWNSLRISFVNEFGNLINDSKNKSGTDSIDRVINFMFENKSYLRYGKGYNGHCLPKDTLAFFTSYKKQDKNIKIIEAVHHSNNIQLELEKSVALAEWYSAWYYGNFLKYQGRAWKDLWKSIKSSKPVLIIRSALKPFIILAEQFVPPRSFKVVTEIWDDKIRQNARFYMNSRTKSGKDVNEFELRDTGREDFKHHIENDGVLKEVLKDFKHKEILEIGCGIGRMTEFIAKNFKHVSSIDISKEAIEYASRRLSEYSNIDIKQSSGDKIPYKDGQFDFVFSYLTLQHLPSLKSLDNYLKEIIRVLKSGGIAKLQFRSGASLRRWDRAYGIVLTVQEVKEITEKLGFKIKKTEIQNAKNFWVVLEK